MMTARVFVSEYLQASFACWSHGYHSSFSLAKIVSATAIRNGSGPAMVYPGLPKKIYRGSGTRIDFSDDDCDIYRLQLSFFLVISKHKITCPKQNEMHAKIKVRCEDKMLKK
jgi:hypothetical protein